MRVSCPPTRFPCFYGIDFPSPGELLASGRDLDSITRHLDVDSVGYLSCEGMLSCVSGPPEHYCTACFSGRYPVEVPAGMDKSVLERSGACSGEDE